MRCGQIGALLAALTTATGAMGAPAGPSEYRFAPGDVLEVTVVPQRLFDRTVTVQPDGKISFPVVGQLQAAGATVGELTERLLAGLSGDLVNPRVTVSLKELNKQAAPRVSLLGAVKTPGVIEIREGATIAEALALGGGPTPLADLRRVAITRGDGTALTVDLAQAENTAAAMRAVVLQPGDILFVPQGPPSTVLVLGEVMKPGSIDIAGEARVLNAISQAGGPTAKADLRHVTLGRSGMSGTRTLDLQALFAGGDVTDPNVNVALQPGDTIIIGETDQRIYVLGRVARPDIYPIRPTERVLDALAKAGGAAADGDLSHAVLVRHDANGQPVPKSVDLNKIMATGTLQGNELLRPGDVLFVPEKKTHHSRAESLNLLWPLTGLINLFRY